MHLRNVRYYQLVVQLKIELEQAAKKWTVPIQDGKSAMSGL